MNSAFFVFAFLASATVQSGVAHSFSGSYGGVEEDALSPVVEKVVVGFPELVRDEEHSQTVISEVDGNIVFHTEDLGALIASGTDFVGVNELRCTPAAEQPVDEGADIEFIVRGGNDPAGSRSAYVVAEFDAQGLCWNDLSSEAIERDGPMGALDLVKVPYTGGNVDAPMSRLAIDSGDVAWTVGPEGVERRDPNWRNVSHFEGKPVRAVVPGVAVLVDSGVWTLGSGEWEKLDCFKIAGNSASDMVATPGGFVVASTSGVWEVDGGSCERIGSGLRPDFHLAVTDDVLWVAAANGVSRFPLGVGTAADEPGCDRPLYGTMLDIWVIEDGGVGVAWPEGSATVSASGCEVDVVDGFPGGESGKPVQGLQAGDRTILASGNGLNTPCLAVRGTDGCIDGLEVGGVTALERFATDREKLWVGTASGLFAADVDLAHPALVDLRSSFGTNVHRVHDIEVGDDGTVWIAHEFGLTLHWPSDAEPSFAFAAVETDGRACPKCGDAAGFSVPYGTENVTADVRGFGYDPAMVVDIDIPGAKVVSDPSASVKTFVLEPGIDYWFEAAVINGSLNRTEIEIPIRRERQSITSRLSGFFTNGLTYVFAALLIGLAALAFVAWRRLGRVRLVDATWKVCLVDGKPSSELTVARPLADRLRSPRPNTFTSDTDFDPERLAFGDGANEGTPALRVGQDLLEAFGGAALSSRLRGAMSKPTTSGVRLRIEIADAEVDRLRALPWELIADDLGHFADDGLTPVRHVADVETVSRTGPLQILVVRTHAAESEVALNDFDRQVTAIQTAFPAEHAASTITVERDVNIEDFDRAITETEWDIIHLYGHGNTDAGGGFVEFASRGEGSPQIYATDIAQTVKGKPLLITVAACRTSNPHGIAEELPGFAEALVANGVAHHAIGFAYETAQVGVGDFVVGFYSQLGKHRQVDVAMRAGRSAITTGIDDRAAVRLYGGTPGGMLYEKR